MYIHIFHIYYVFSLNTKCIVRWDSFKMFTFWTFKTLRGTLTTLAALYLHLPHPSRDPPQLGPVASLKPSKPPVYCLRSDPDSRLARSRRSLSSQTCNSDRAEDSLARSLKVPLLFPSHTAAAAAAAAAIVSCVTSTLLWL